MPAVLKVYAEMEGNAGIRAAIEYAVSRFYAVYQESFAFQSLDVISHILTFPSVDCDWMAQQTHTLFLSLSSHSPLFAPDHAGIHGANQREEQEALLIYTAEEKPQAILSLLRREKSSKDLEFDVPDQYEGGKLTPDNLARLFLTVIGHDPGVRRAQHFLHLMGYMLPHLYADRHSYSVLRGGIEALSTIFISRSSGSNRKVPENAQLKPQTDSSFTVYSQAGSDFFGETRSPSDLATMRLDYLRLVTAFARSGGYLESNSASASRIIDLVKIVLKEGENDPTVASSVSNFVAEYTRSALIRNPPLKLKHILAFLRNFLPVYKTHAALIDFSGTLSVLLELSQSPSYANEPAFTTTVVGQYCIIALDACEHASSSPRGTLELRHVLVKLICHAVLMKGVDVMSILEKQAITYDFVADILVPFALGLQSEVARKTELRRTALAHTRLLLMVMSACENASSHGGSPRPAQLERSNSKSEALLPMFMQVIKIIILRGEEDLSTTMPGIWAQLGQFLKRMLADGGTHFALQALDGDGELSRPSSPSRQNSLPDDPSNPFAPPSRSNSFSTRNTMRPRVVDYLFWSMLEFACLHRSPLLMQLRLVMQTTAARLETELRAQIAPSPRARRLSVFAKPRRRSGYHSGGTTPETSPFLRPAGGLQSRRGSMQSMGLSASSLEPQTPQKDPSVEVRLPGFARDPSPLSSPSHAPTGPRIVHLGPVQANPGRPGGGLFARGSGHSGDGDGERPALVAAARKARVHSIVLVRATFRRVRVVQQVMGYTLLLPLVDGEGEDAIGEVQTWTRRQALEAVRQETEELKEEFGGGAGWEDEGILVDADMSFSSLAF
jgi:hypothetical protein